MKYVKTCKAIRIDDEIMNKIYETRKIFEQLEEELEEIYENDHEYREVLCNIWNVGGCMDDFITSYKRAIYED